MLKCKKMKKMLKLISAAIVLLLFSVSTYAQTTLAANAAAVIIEPITITQNSALNFGTIMRGSTPSTVVVSTTGVRSLGSGDAILSSLAPAASAATFTIDGSDGAAYTITIPTLAVNITSGANTMSVDSWTSNPAAPITGNFPSPGTVSLSIGATLTVGAGQASGSYTGTFNVSVDYN
jgi:hypothetical protein